MTETKPAVGSFAAARQTLGILTKKERSPTYRERVIKEANDQAVTLAFNEKHHFVGDLFFPWNEKLTDNPLLIVGDGEASEGGYISYQETFAPVLPKGVNIKLLRAYAR